MEKNSQFTYKGLPLARCGNSMFYGDSSKDRVVRIDVISRKKVKDIEIPDKLEVKLVNTMLASKGNVKNSIKSSEKSSLYSCLDLAFAWLERLA